MRNLETVTVFDCHDNIIRKKWGVREDSFLCETPETETKFDGISYVSFYYIRLSTKSSIVEHIID